VVLAVAGSTLTGGGFSDSSQLLLVLTAGAALLLVAGSRTAAAAAAARSPLVAALGMLAALSLLSAAWTVGSPADALRWGLVIAAYGSLAVASAVLCDRFGVRTLMSMLAVLAVVEALLGLAAVATHSLPDAERIYGVWRPGGSFEYQPALALLEVATIPVLLSALRWGRAASAPAAAGLVIVGAGLGISGDRLGVALAIVVVIAYALRSAREPAWRTPVCVGALLLAAAAMLADLTLVRAAGGSRHAGGLGALLPLLALALAGAVLWDRARTLTWRIRPGVAVACAACLLVAAAALAAVHLHSADFLHGRNHEWLAAIQTWLDRPLLGAGADAYYVASLPHQTVAVARYAHDLPLELAAELGCGGLLLAVLLYAAGIRALVAARRSDAAWLAGPMLLAFLISNLVDWTWHLAGLGAIWAICAGAVIGADAAQRAAPQAPPTSAERSPRDAVAAGNR
jgi:hypothetical protein